MISRTAFLLFASLALHHCSSFAVPHVSHCLRPPTGTSILVPVFTSYRFHQQPDLFSTPNDNEKSTVSVSIWVKFNEAGMTLKPKAIAAATKRQAPSTSMLQKVTYGLQSSMLYSLFLLYRAFRGFCVILPAVFQEVRRKLQTAMPEEEVVVVQDDVVDPTTGKVRLRTSLTISVLASIVTAKYVVTGGIRVLGKFIRGRSFAAAADEVTNVENEMLIMSKEAKGINGDAAGTMVP
jgi:hypothetical protein